MAPLESTKNKRLGLKALLLVCMFPVFLGAGFGGIFFNYFMARDNAQKRIDDHIFRRRMDLGYISLLPALNVTFDNIELGLENEAEFFRKQAADYTAAYLKRMSPPFEHILRVVLLNGDELFRIENGQVAAPLQVSVSSVLITSLKALEPDKQPTLPTFSLPVTAAKRIRDILPIYHGATRELIGAIVCDYGFPVDEIMGPVRETLAFNLFLAFATLIIALVITYLILDLNIRPLRLLTARVQKMTSGDLSHPVDIKARGETAILADSFETLRQRLKNQIELLKTNANELARSLDEAERTKGQLKDERDYTAGILSETPNIVCGIDPAGLIRFVNPSGERISGYSRQELVGKPIQNILFPEDGGDFIADLLNGRDTTVSTNRESRLATKLGSQREMLWNSIRRMDNQGNIKEAILIGNDITELKRVETELRKFRTISDKSNYGSAIFDLQARITYINDAYAAMHGYEARDLYGRPQSIFFGERLAEQQNQLNERLMSRGYLTAEEVSHIRRDGTEFPLLINCILVRDENGEPLYSSETAIDITEKKNLEEQLQIRQRMDSLGTMLGGIAHDFNNLLSGITGYLDLLHLGSDNFSSKQKHYMEQLNSSVQRAADLIQRFQILSHASVSKKSSLDIADIVASVFSVLRKTADPKIQQQNLIEPGRFFVSGNRSDLIQVLLNLAINAKEAILSKGAIESDFIRIQARNVLISETRDKTLLGGRYVYITVSDSGCGMDESVRAKAFDPLFSSKKFGERKGQGLGLALVYSLIKQHNGHITVGSTPGRGTTFHVYLPAAPPADNRPKTDSELPNGSETILLVDDESMLRNVIKEELELLGYSVLTAGDGLEALRIYQSRVDDIHLLILDAFMPKLSGELLLNKMFAINPEARIIVISGHREAQLSEPIRSRARAVLAKPLVFKDLAIAVRNTLDM